MGAPQNDRVHSVCQSRGEQRLQMLSDFRRMQTTGLNILRKPGQGSGTTRQTEEKRSIKAQNLCSRNVTLVAITKNSATGVALRRQL